VQISVASKEASASGAGDAGFRFGQSGLPAVGLAGAVTRPEVEAKVAAWIACWERGHLAAAPGGVRRRMV
jgi:hypothetical protein